MVTLLACPQMTTLAKRIADCHSGIDFGTIRWGIFADGYPDIMIDNVESFSSCRLFMKFRAMP